MVGLVEKINELINNLEAEGNTVLNVKVEILSSLERKVVILYKTPSGTINMLEKTYIYVDATNVEEVA